MSRIWIAAGLMIVVLSACGDSSTTLPPGSDGTSGVDDGGVLQDGTSGIHDGSGLDDSGSQPDGAVAQDGAVGQDSGGAACIPATSPGTRGMKSGQACLDCHATMSGNRKFTLAGTLYTNAAGSAKVSGATVRLTDGSGKVIDLPTGSDGAFFTTQTIAFPVTVQASKCPDVQVMPKAATQGNCNSCHTAGNRIHL